MKDRIMPWYAYVAHFVAGRFLTNEVPNFVQGICGNEFKSPFATRCRIGESSAIVNLIWGWFYFVAGSALLRVFFPLAGAARRFDHHHARRAQHGAASSQSLWHAAQRHAASMTIGMSKGHARVLAVLVFGLFGGVAGAGQEGEDMKLEDMGFVMRPANTPAQVARLKLLPPRKFVARTEKGRRYYIYADPDYCKCAFVGNDAAMKNYQNLVTPFPQAPMTVGPEPPSLGSEMIEEIDPGIGLAIPGDIFDTPD
jgi:hypothetical protein